MKFIEGLKKRLGSKKCQALITGILLVVFQEGRGLSNEASLSLIGLVSVYILGQGVADAGKEAVRVEKEMTEQIRKEKGR